MKLNNGIELDLQIIDAEYGKTDYCIQRIDDINKGELDNWDKKRLELHRRYLLDLIEWRDAMLPIVADYINSFGMNFYKNTYFHSDLVEDGKFAYYDILNVSSVQFGYKKNKVEVNLTV